MMKESNLRPIEATEIPLGNSLQPSATISFIKPTQNVQSAATARQLHLINKIQRQQK